MRSGRVAATSDAAASVLRALSAAVDDAGGAVEAIELR